jgi:putative FmdB family regulatory protein
MPIYAYRCDACGHAKDVLQKISDPVLSTCPACGADAFRKQLTAAGFQLKGSGWYVTDFKSGQKPAETKAAPESKPADAKAPEAKAGDTPPAASASAAPAPGGDAKAASSTAPAAGTGG